MAPVRFPALALALAWAFLALPAAAQTNNPLGTGLPLNVHARATCSENAGPLGTVIDDQVGAAAASCSAGSHAQASADLSSGTLKVVASSTALPGGLIVGLGQAGLYEALTFSSSNCVPGASCVEFVTLNMSLHGSFSGLAQDADVIVNLLSTSLPSSVRIHESSTGQIYLPAAPVGTVTTNADPATWIFPRGDVRADLTKTFAVTPGQPVWFLASLRVQSGLGNEVVDFGHTAQLSLDLPPGVTFTSASGQFLTAVVTPVPEPGMAWLLLTGVVPLAARLRWVRAQCGRDAKRRGEISA
jgi:hypothetical protein